MNLVGLSWDSNDIVILHEDTEKKSVKKWWLKESSSVPKPMDLAMHPRNTGPYLCSDGLIKKHTSILSRLFILNIHHMYSPIFKRKVKKNNNNNRCLFKSIHHPKFDIFIPFFLRWNDHSTSPSYHYQQHLLYYSNSLLCSAAARALWLVRPRFWLGDSRRAGLPHDPSHFN